MSFTIGVLVAFVAMGIVWGVTAGIRAISGDVTPKATLTAETRDLNADAVRETLSPKKILAEPVYDPPCGPSDTHNCIASPYSKSKVSGKINTVIFNSDTPTVENDHLQPDYTEVEYSPDCYEDCLAETVRFCGNMLDMFTPGKHFSMILTDSKVSDYNGCYTIGVVDTTFGGKKLKTVKVPHPTVPGAN